ncbi:hypothetical protein O9X98_04285 [Agrobacterium salinitolerans]|nr:hypothetical protein [Agrobacterium salinitolerans]
MLVLGHIDKGYRPESTDYVLDDGKVVGPFESDRAMALFGKWFGSKADRLFTARELYEETVGGDEYRIVNADEWSLETHPFGEVYDIWIEGDNGKVVLDRPRGFQVVDPRRLVIVDSPYPCERKRTLAAPVDAPDWIDLERHETPAYVVKSKHHGEIAVFRDHGKSGQRFTVGWRRDGRQLKDVVGLSLHSHLETAVKAADARAEDFAPAGRKRINRPRDSQREALYLWEHSFAADFVCFDNVSEAADLAHRICYDLGVPQVTVSLGRANLITMSYYKGGEVVLNRDMVNNHTLVHEVAHHLVRHLKLAKEPSHGPIFAGALLALMKEYMGADIDEALEKARDREIVVNLDVFGRVSEVIATRKAAQSMPHVAASPK